MKRLFCLLAILVSVLLLWMPAGANTIEKLQEVQKNLTSYLYTPYFEKAEAYPEYAEAFREVNVFLKEDTTPTQKEISQHYERIKGAFSALMLETFDYSEIIKLKEFYQTMDASLFTPESWEKLVSCADTIIRELESPMLYARKVNMSFEEYSKTMQKHIRTLANNFIDAYNALVLDIPENNVSKDQLGFLAQYTEKTADRVIFKNSSLWREYELCLEEAKTTAGLRNPRQTRIDEATDELLDSYQKLLTDALQKNAVTDVFAQYNLLKSEDFTSLSWERYEANVNELKDRMGRPYFIYLPESDNEKELKLYTDRFFTVAAEYSNSSYQLLVSMDSYNELKSLCLSYQNTTCSEGLEAKRNRLLSRIDDAKELMNSEHLVPAQVQSACEEIRAAAEDLELAEKFLSAEQEGVVKQDSSTIQKIILFTALALILSLGFACVCSYQYFGKLNWRR